MYKAIAANKRNTVLIMAVFVGIISAIGWAVSYFYGNTNIAYFVIAGAALYAILQYFLASKLAIAMTGAEQIQKRDNPRLYRIVENLAITLGMQTPKVYIINDPALNAFATGRDPKHAIVAATTGLMDTLSDDELEAVMAHELGHILYNHTNKRLLLIAAIYGGFQLFKSSLMAPIRSQLAAAEPFSVIDDGGEPLSYFSQTASERLAASARVAERPMAFSGAAYDLGALLITLGLTRLIINKRFEKEADAFVYQVTDNGQGLVEFCEHLEKKEEKIESQFDGTRAKIQANSSDVGFINYLGLMMRYYAAKTGYVIGNGYKWLCYNTPFGDHPSPAARIKYTQEYLDQKPA